MFGGLARGAASAGLAFALWLAATGLGLAATGLAASPALASSKPAAKPTTGASSPHSSGSTGTTKKTTKKTTKSPPPPLRPGPLPGPVQGCLDEHGSPVPSGTPWAQQALDYQSVWQFTEGQGITVAVIDSGVDANPQFDGRVIVGPTSTQAAAPAGPANGDCVGHGTSVAGIIAAAPMAGVAFAGVAPQATILSIKVTNTEGGITASVVAEAILDAVQDGAKVINLSLTAPDTPALSEAVAYALKRNVVVVASAGNDTTDSGTGPFYPAAYPGVLSVGAVDSDGDLADFSDVRTPVSVTAPGIDITSTFPGTYPDSYLAGQQGTSFATAFVSGVAALVRARYPQFTAPEVAARIEETADGAAGPGTGDGLVNPVQAVTAVLPVSLTATNATGRQGEVSVDRAASDGREKTMAMSVTAGALGAAVLVMAAAAVIPAGRRRRWRPGGDQ